MSVNREFVMSIRFPIAMHKILITIYAHSGMNDQIDSSPSDSSSSSDSGPLFIPIQLEEDQNLDSENTQSNNMENRDGAAEEREDTPLLDQSKDVDTFESELNNDYDKAIFKALSTPRSYPPTRIPAPKNNLSRSLESFRDDTITTVDDTHLLSFLPPKIELHPEILTAFGIWIRKIRKMAMVKSYKEWTPKKLAMQAMNLYSILEQVNAVLGMDFLNSKCSEGISNATVRHFLAVYSHYQHMAEEDVKSMRQDQSFLSQGSTEHMDRIVDSLPPVTYADSTLSGMFPVQSDNISGTTSKESDEDSSVVLLEDSDSNKKKEKRTKPKENQARKYCSKNSKENMGEVRNHQHNDRTNSNNCTEKNSNGSIEKKKNSEKIIPYPCTSGEEERIVKKMKINSIQDGITKEGKASEGAQQYPNNGRKTETPKTPPPTKAIKEENNAECSTGQHDNPRRILENNNSDLTTQNHPPNNKKPAAISPDQGNREIGKRVKFAENIHEEIRIEYRESNCGNIVSPSKTPTKSHEEPIYDTSTKSNGENVLNGAEVSQESQAVGNPKESQEKKSTMSPPINNGKAVKERNARTNENVENGNESISSANLKCNYSQEMYFMSEFIKNKMREISNVRSQEDLEKLQKHANEYLKKYE